MHVLTTAPDVPHRCKGERIQRKLRRSRMRMHASDYGALNVWEIAYFKDTFQRADLDGDGYITCSQVYRLLAELGEEPKNEATWEVRHCLSECL
jgi:hypothetical protein